LTKGMWTVSEGERKKTQETSPVGGRFAGGRDGTSLDEIGLGTEYEKSGLKGENNQMTLDVEGKKHKGKTKTCACITDCTTTGDRTESVPQKKKKGLLARFEHYGTRYRGEGRANQKARKKP